MRLPVWAARRLAQPVGNGFADSSGGGEHFLGDEQGREKVTTAKLAARRTGGNGRFLGLAIDSSRQGRISYCYAPFHYI